MTSIPSRALAVLAALAAAVLLSSCSSPASDGQIAVSLWLGRDPRIALAAPATLEVA